MDEWGELGKTLYSGKDGTGRDGAVRSSSRVVPLGPIAQGIEVRDVDLLAGDLLGAVFRDQLVETVLLPAYCDDEDAGIDHPFGQGLADARSSPGDEHGLVWERHRAINQVQSLLSRVSENKRFRSHKLNTGDVVALLRTSLCTPADDVRPGRVPHTPRLCQYV